MRTCFAVAILAVSSAAGVRAAPPASEGVRVLADVPYKEGPALTEYERERCKLDVYLPQGGEGFATLVWFHGGGLKNGDKDGRQIASDSVKTAKIARSLAAAGMAVVAPNYRLSPKVVFPAYVRDAAAAVAWARRRMGGYGGDAARIFIGGHSAGGYLALMLGMEGRYLADAGVKPGEIAGLVSVSGQTMTHYTVREERGEGKFSITADDAAPVHFARRDTMPMLVLYADQDMPARAEENAYFVALMSGAGSKSVTGRKICGRTHGSIASEIENEGDPGRAAILEFIRTNGGMR